MSLVHTNTRVEIRKLEITFAPRCQWTRGNLPVRGTCQTGTEEHCIGNVEFKNIKTKTGRQSLYFTYTMTKNLLGHTKPCGSDV